MTKIKTRFGVQNSVIGWDDPWHRESCKTMMRTGEQMYFSSQDSAPTKSAFLHAIRDGLGADFYVHYCMPNDAEIARFIADMDEFGLDFFLGNEFGNANKIYTPGTNRYDVPLVLVKKAIATGKFLGLYYDETDHLQMNNMIYQQDPELYQWTNPGEKSLDETEEDFVASVAALCRECGCDVYAEVLFATLYHALGRGGIHLSPKSMKEVKQPVQFATAMGAIRQYGRKMGLTVDTWGPDVGDWFTRLWCFPGHSPVEFRNGLKMSYLLGPDFMFVENADVLMRSKGDSFEFTEYGEIYREFIANADKIDRPYSAHDCDCEIAVVHSDDGVFCKYGTFMGGGPYGSHILKNDDRTNSWFHVMHVLTHKRVNDSASTMHASGEGMPATTYPRDPETLKKFPLKHGAGVGVETKAHPLFVPMNKTLVFDDKVRDENLKSAKVIVVCGSRLSDEGRKAVLRAADRGVPVLMADWLAKGTHDNVTQIDDFRGEKFAERIAPYLGRDDEWRIGYGEVELVVTNPSGDGNSLEFEIRACR